MSTATFGVEKRSAICGWIYLARLKHVNINMKIQDTDYDQRLYLHVSHWQSTQNERMKSKKKNGNRFINEDTAVIALISGGNKATASKEW